jgi:3'(2'), 5'-bisphosphate nucleotidase
MSGRLQRKLNVPTDAETRSLLQAITALAQNAGRAIMNFYDTAYSVESKSDDSPLTAADKASHDVITAGLKELTPSIPVLSEESAAHIHDYAQRQPWTRFWLVDPLDGTKEFIKRNGEFTVNIALVEGHEPVLGVVAAPALGVVYYGARGLGGWKQRDGGEPEALRPAVPAREVPVIVGSRSHRDTSLDGLLERIGPHELRPMGSSLKFCLVAEGTADFYPRFGPTSEWDTAAAQAILESVGGHVTDVHGEPLRYNARPTLLNPNFIAFADPGREWRRFI